jgi:hypothetical protein
VDRPSEAILEHKVPLERLVDQTTHREPLKFVHVDGSTQSTCQLNCELQWIHSRNRFLTEIIDKWDKRIIEQNVEKKDYEAAIQALYAPFPGIKGYQNNNLNLASTAKFIEASPNVAVSEPALAKFNRGESNFGKIILYLMIALVLLALCTSFVKDRSFEVGSDLCSSCWH